MTMSFETMIDSATEATMTMAVAAEKPPMKVISVTHRHLAGERQRQHVEIGIARCRRRSGSARRWPPAARRD